MQSPFASSSSGVSPASITASNLGELVSEHPSSGQGFFVIAGVLTVAGFALLGYYKIQPDPLWLIGGVLLVPGGMASGVWGITKKGLDAKRYENGLILTQSGQTVALRWEDIASIVQKVTRVYTNGVHTSTTHVYWITGRDGRTWKLDDSYRYVDVIGDQVQVEVAKCQLPGLIQEFKAGRPVQFGDLMFDSKGITNGKTLIPWTDFKSIDFKNGHLRVHKPKDGMRGLLTGGSMVINVSELPNLYTLIGFIENLPVYERGLE